MAAAVSVVCMETFSGWVLTVITRRDKPCRDLMESFGVSRAGNRIVENVGVAITHGHRAGMFHHAGGFVYTDKSGAAKVRNRSVFATTERKIEWVSPEELDASLLDVVTMVGHSRYLHLAVAINCIHGLIMLQYLHHATRLKGYRYETPDLMPSPLSLVSWVRSSVCGSF